MASNLHYIASSKTMETLCGCPRTDRAHLVKECVRSVYHPSVYLVVSQCKAHKDSLKQRISRGTDDNLQNSRRNERLEPSKRYPTIKRGQLFDMLCIFQFLGSIILCITASLKLFDGKFLVGFIVQKIPFSCWFIRGPKG